MPPKPENKLVSADLYAVVQGCFKPVDAATAGDIVLLPGDCFYDSSTITSNDITPQHNFTPLLKPSFVMEIALPLKVHTTPHTPTHTHAHTRTRNGILWRAH